MDDLAQEIDLPGFRFHPTEEELLNFYLKNIIFGKKLRYDIIGCLNIYKHDPWDLPGMAKIGEREWYFFVPRDRKHGGGGRPNRTTETGFWKATGSDRKIMSLSDPKRTLGLRKTLVFYMGRAPRGHKTDWVMNEYRLPDNWCLPKDIVLCKIYRKATSLKVLEQRAAMEEEMKIVDVSPSSSPLSSMDTTFCCPQEDSIMPQMSVQHHHAISKKDLENIKAESTNGIITGSSMVLPFSGKDKLPEIQVPKLSIDWNQDGFSLNSPWLQNLMTPNYANILNF